MLGLSASLAANLAAGYIDNPHPNLVILFVGGAPPLIVFIAIEILTKNPWHLTGWGLYAQRTMCVLVAVPAGAISFAHLAHLIVNGHEHEWLSWMIGILTPLMVDGLLVGSTAALLLPVVPRYRVVTSDDGEKTGPIDSNGSQNGETIRAPRKMSPGRGTADPLHRRWREALNAGAPWDKQRMLEEMQKTNPVATLNAARVKLKRWTDAENASNRAQ